MIERLLKARKKGSSLMFVIIAVAFIGILATLALRITVINVQTKSVDRTVKKSFYSTESVMDKLNITLQNVSKDAMKEAYVYIMENYTTTAYDTTDQNKVQNEFARKYIDKLLEKLSTDSAQISATYQLPYGSKYKVDYLREQMNNTFGDNIGDCIITESGRATLKLDFNPNNYNEDKILTLQNMQVKYSENVDASDKDSEIATWITTDVKLVVPRLSFESGNIYPEFTKYAIIGDDRVDAIYANAAKVYGNVYAGENGLNVSGGNNDTLEIGGSSTTVVTRGDITVEQTGGLTLGSSTYPIDVWAENYKTKNSTTRYSTATAKLVVYANSYIHDDLSLDSVYSDVEFDYGSYNGYTFNKDNTDDSVTTVDSGYSSAIVINGRHSSLKMGDNMQKILLGGRAFISRSQDIGNAVKDASGNVIGKLNTDIPLGESISVKSDQYYYLVKNEELNAGFSNPMTVASYKSLITTRKPMSRDVASGLSAYVNVSDPVTTYTYSISGTDENAGMVYFYYNFKNQDAADAFFDNKISKAELGERIVSSKYLKFDSGANGITISQNLTLLTAGNALTMKNESGLSVEGNNLTGATETLYKKTAKYNSAKYKSYQLTLSDGDAQKYNQTGVAEGEYGFNLTDKSSNPVFDTIITKLPEGEFAFVKDARERPSEAGFKLLKNSIYYKAVPVEISDSTKVFAIFLAETNSAELTGAEDDISLKEVLTELQSTMSYQMNTSTAIVVSNRNVKVDCYFHGLVMSKNRVLVADTISVTAESALLQSMFTKQKMLEGSVGLEQRFLTYFKRFADLTYGENADTAEDVVDISKYVKYSNWKKNNE